MKPQIIKWFVVASLLVVISVSNFYTSSAQSRRTYSLIYSQNLQGGHTMFGNTIMAVYSSGSGSTGTVDTASMNDFSTSGTGNYTFGRTSAFGNDGSNMQFLDVDGTGTNASPSILNDYAQSWSYYSNGNYSSAPGSWPSPAAANFTSANAPLRFNLGSGGTTLGNTSRNTYYFRNTTINIIKTNYSSFSISVRYDDGIVVYVNGTEVGRSDMPTGTVTYSTAASSCNTTGTYRTATFNVPLSAINNGNNTVTAEVHQGSGCSGNATMYFDLMVNGFSTVANAASSSSADLILPASGTNTIKFARLYWGGRIDSAAIQSDFYNLRTVRIRKGTSGNYTNILAPITQLDTIVNGAGSSTYQAYADVTSLISSNGSGTYTVGDIAATTGTNPGDNGGNYAGWAIVVAYTNSVQTDFYSTRIYDGFLRVYAGGTPTTVGQTLTGFNAPANALVASDAYLTAFAWEGDANLGASSSNPAGDFLQINGNAYSDAVNPAANMWNGTISQNGVLVTSKNPNYKNQMGIDIDNILVGSGYVISPNATQVSILFGTEADSYFPSNFAFSLHMKNPALTINKTATGDLQTVPNTTATQVHANETFTYTISGQNTGAGTSFQTRVVDSIPRGTAYVPGSLNIITSGESGAIGVQTDAAGDDEAFFTAAAGGKRGYVTFYVGNNATPNAGGQLDTGKQYKVTFRVKSPFTQLATISNVADVYATAQNGDSLTNESSFVINYSNPLSVNLTSFIAEAKNNSSVLSWTTSGEKNSDYFNVEYSADGKVFNTVGTIKASGTTDLTHDYSFIHTSPLVGMNYYRLKVVDVDATFSYSNVRTVWFDNFEVGTVKVMPNPTTGNTRIMLPASLGNHATVNIYNSLGVVVYRASVSNQQFVDFDVSNLLAGLYNVIVMDDESHLYEVKIVKQ
ncbi:T9SS type A sorting domain-containing protein [Taibaiella soli]|nr:T9SS type A sorting domain-containing protein [Taibaiella soli]